MPAATATGAELVNASRSHFITLDWMNGHGGGSGFGPVCEEVHPIARATWRGKLYRVELEASRYRHTSGWSDWRVYARSTEELEPDGSEMDYMRRRPGTDKARAAMSEATAPLVREWLGSSRDYDESRRRELARGIAREVREAAGATYNLDRARRALEAVGDELEPETAQELRRLVGVAQELGEALEALTRY